MLNVLDHINVMNAAPPSCESLVQPWCGSVQRHTENVTAFPGPSGGVPRGTAVVA